MTDNTSSVFSAAGDEARRMWRNAAEMVRLRRKLAETEIIGDVEAGKRLGIAAAAGVVLTLTGLPVLAIVLGGQLDRWISGGAPAFPWATLALGGVLMAAGLLIAWSGWRRFRRDFSGLQASLAEIKEDLVWIREWVDGGETDAPSD